MGSKKTPLIISLAILAILVLCLSLIIFNLIYSSRKAADESHDSLSQNINFDPIYDIGSKPNTAETTTRRFSIDNRVSGSSPAVIVTAECSVQAVEITEDERIFVTITSYADEVSNLVGEQSLLLDCTPRIDKDTVPPPPDAGSEAVAEFGWPQGSNPPLGSIKIPDN